MTKKVKKYIFPTALTASLSISAAFAIGMIIGYLGTTFFHKKFIRTGKINIVTFDFGDWKIHLHHWIMGGLAIFAIYLVGFLSSLPIFFIGTLGGLIFHDLYTDKNWYKIVRKKESIN